MLPESPSFSASFLTQCRTAGVTHVVSVPDGYLAPLIWQVVKDERILHIPAAREEEAIGIAAGLSMAGKRVLVMMQNVGFLNSLGCFSTLALNYRTPFALLLSHRGNLFDKNTYDMPKMRFMNNILEGMNLFTHSAYQFRHEPDLIKLVLDQSYTAGEPAVLLLDMPPEGRKVQ
jgi:sulfopyruvate decarboxylase alpha subunit